MSISKLTTDSEDDALIEWGESVEQCERFAEGGACMHGDACTFVHQQGWLGGAKTKREARVTRAMLENFPEMVLMGASLRAKSFLE